MSASLLSVHLWKSPVEDFSPLAACTNLDYLDVPGTKLADLEVVRGRKLRVALLYAMTGTSKCIKLSFTLPVS